MVDKKEGTALKLIEIQANMVIVIATATPSNLNLFVYLLTID